MKNFIYYPPLTTRVAVNLIFPWQQKEYKIKEVSLKDLDNQEVESEHGDWCEIDECEEI